MLRCANERLGDNALRLARNFDAAEVQLIYRGRNIVAVEPRTGMCIKSFKCPGFFKGLIYGLFRAPKARRAFNNAERLISLGLPTPEPYCALIEYRGFLLGQSYYVCRYLEGWHDLRGIEHRPDFEAIIHGLAALMLDLHRKHVFVKDFTQGNILFRRKAGEGYDFSMVDINRIDFDVDTRKELILNFGSVLDTRNGVGRLAAEYARQSDMDVEAFVAEVLGVFDSRQKVLWRRRRFKERFLRRNKR